MGYYDISVIVDGALDFEGTWDDEEYERSYEELYEKYRVSSVLPANVPVAVFVMYHDHDVAVRDCVCSQYVTDHNPVISWNRERE